LKPGAIALHYRSAPKLADAVRREVESAAATNPDLRSIHGKMVSEVALSRAGKGTAILELLKIAPFSGKLPVMVGDDVTDEDGFRAAKAVGGFGLKVGDGPTEATYSVDTIDDFRSWLKNALTAR
jgi:trehalose 6-phosphate phosphatase